MPLSNCPQQQHQQRRTLHVSHSELFRCNFRSFGSSEVSPGLAPRSYEQELLVSRSRLRGELVQWNSSFLSHKQDGSASVAEARGYCESGRRVKSPRGRYSSFVVQKSLALSWAQSSVIFCKRKPEPIASPCMTPYTKASPTNR